MLIHTYLNLPDFQPLHGIENFANVSWTNDEIKARIPKVIKNQLGIEMGAVRYARMLAHQDYTAYCVSLIPELENNIAEIGFQFQTNDTNHLNGSQLFPHTDGPRGKFCIHWNFTTGSDSDVTTYWWQEKNYPLIRDPFTTRFYTDLTEVDRVVWQNNKWGLFRTDILHGVSPIKTSREAFTIGFNDEDLFHHIVEKYGVK